MKIPEMVLSWLFFCLAILVVLALIVHCLPYFGYDPRDISLKLWYGPEIINGQYVLTSHGQATTISRDVFVKQRLYEARAESGHWMLFYGMCIHALHRKVMRSGAAN